MADLGLDHMWKDMPRIVGWYEEIRAHSAFKPTYYFGSLLTEHFPHLKARAGSL
jgi:glutathione S-transferase